MGPAVATWQPLPERRWLSAKGSLNAGSQARGWGEGSKAHLTGAQGEGVKRVMATNATCFKKPKTDAGEKQTKLMNKTPQF